MNCRDDCTGLCFLGGFSEEVSDQWIRPTEEGSRGNKGQAWARAGL